MKLIDRSKVRPFFRSLLSAAKVPEADTALVVDALMTADAEGIPSHGVGLLPMYIERILAGSVSASAKIATVSDDDGALVLDAANSLGQVSSHLAVAMMQERMSKHPLTCIVVRNGFHFGAAGYWAKMLASHDCVGIAMSNTGPLMAAPGSADRLIGNNPMAIAVPAVGEILTLDLALTAGAMGKIRLAAAEGKTIPHGWAVDKDGQPTVDPKAAIEGALLPAGGAKGFGLAFMIDLLTGGLSSGAIKPAIGRLIGDPLNPYRCSHFYLAIRISAFRDLARFKADASFLANMVRGAKPIFESTPVRLFGDRAATERAKHSTEIPVADATLNAFIQCAGKLGIDVPSEFSDKLSLGRPA